MRLYYNSATPPAETWVRVSAIVGFPDITTRNNMVGRCVVVLRDFQGGLFSTWNSRDLTEMKVEDDSSNILFRGYLMRKTFHDRDLVLEIAGIGIMLYRRSFGSEEVMNYILEDGFPKTLNASSVIDLQYKDSDGNFQDFTWAVDKWIDGDKDVGILIKDTTAGFTTVEWDCADPIAVSGNDGAPTGDFSSTQTFDDGDYYIAKDTTGTPDLVITPTIEDGNIPNTNKLKEIQIEYSFRGRLDGIGWIAIQLQIKKDSDWITIDSLELYSFASWYDYTTPWIQALPDSLKEGSHVHSITEGGDDSELQKYFTDAGGNYTKLKGMQFIISGHDLNGDAYIHIDYIKVNVIYHADDVLPTMRQITDSAASSITCDTVSNWQEKGITVAIDAFQIGENTRKILQDIGNQSGLSINYGTNGTQTLTTNQDISTPWSFSTQGNHYDSIDADDASIVQAQAADDAETEEIGFTTFTLTDMDSDARVSKLVLTVKAKDSGHSKAFGAGLYFDGAYQSGISVTLTGSYVTYTKIYYDINLDQTELDALKVRLVSDIMGIGETISVSFVSVVATWSSYSVLTKYMARKFKGAHCIEPLKAVCKLEGTDWMEDYVNNQLKIIRVADFPDSGVTLTQADYDHDWEYEDICNAVKYVYVWGKTSFNETTQTTSNIFAKAIDTSVTGEKSLQIIDDNIMTTSEAQEIANTQRDLLNTKRPSIRIPLNGVNEDLQLGTTVTLTMVRPTVSQAEYPIRMIERKRFGKTGIQTIVYCGMGETKWDEKIIKDIQKNYDLAHKNLTAQLTSTPYETGVGGIMWGDVGGAEDAVNVLIAVAGTYDAHNFIGVANKAEVPCALASGDLHSEYAASSFLVRNLGGGDFAVMWTLPGYPLTRDGLKLYISNLLIGVGDADADDFLTRTRLIAYNDTPAIDSVLFDSNVDKKVIEIVDYSGDGAWAGPYDMSGYTHFQIYLDINATTASQVDIAFVNVEIYYDT